MRAALALTATIYNVEIDLADNDRGVYESLALCVARHPSESDQFLATRLLAYSLEFAQGLEFSKGGLSNPDEPAMSIRDLTGALRAWVEVGTPDAARLHRASKAAPRVAVYLHKEPVQFLRALEGARIHRADAIDVWSFDRSLMATLTAGLERRMAFALSVTQRELCLSIGADVVTGDVIRHPLPARS